MLAAGACSGVGARMLRPTLFFDPLMLARVHRVKPSVFRLLRGTFRGRPRGASSGVAEASADGGTSGQLHRAAGIGETRIRFKGRRVGNRQYHGIRRSTVSAACGEIGGAVSLSSIVRSSEAAEASMPKAGRRAIASS